MELKSLMRERFLEFAGLGARVFVLCVGIVLYCVVLHFFQA